MTSASDDKACVSKFNQVENDIQNYINAQLIILQDSAYDAGYEAGQAAALRSPAPAATVTGWRLLEVGEVVKIGDECYHPHNEEWFELPEFEGEKVKENDSPVRRRLPAPPVDAVTALADKWEVLANEAEKHSQSWEMISAYLYCAKELRSAVAALRGAGGEGE